MHRATPEDAIAARQTCWIIRHSHFDPTWRRCWDRDFVDDGVRFVSYRTLQEAWMGDMLAGSADARNKFMVETTWTTRHYLERHPEARETLRQLLREGRFEQLGAGENIMDSNLVHGELLARNLVLGALWSEQVLGARPSTGYYRDAFGTSAQLPQIFRQCGYRWIAHLDYNIPDAPYWRGLDGSTVLYLHPALIPYAWACVPGAGSMHPCPECKGAGCAACDARGYVVGRRSDFLYRPAQRWEARAVIFLIGNEENLPGMHVGEDVARFNAEQTDFFAVQGTYHDLEPLLAPELAQLDAPSPALLSGKVENNPCITGVYVGRIKLKQQHRALEHALLAAETWDVLLNGSAQAEALRSLWRNLTFSGFHDAITASCCDDAYRELLDLQAAMWQQASGLTAAALLPALLPRQDAYTLFNRQGVPASVPVRVAVPGAWEGAAVTCDGAALPVYEVERQGETTRVTFQSPVTPALGGVSVTLAPARARVRRLDTREVRCDPYTVTLGEHGPSEVRVEGIGPVTDCAEWLFGELVLEEDQGDPWSTRSLSRTRERLSAHTTLQYVEEEGDSLAVHYTGKHPSMGVFGPWDPMVLLLEWTQTFRLRAGSPWLEIDTTVDWFTYNRRLRLAFPSASRANCGVYEIPYGVLERERYDAQSADFIEPDGDWPAIHWAGVQNEEYTFAIFNQGTPSYRVEQGCVLLSLLRSPASPGGLLQPAQFVAHNFSTITDHGRHQFHHALFLGAGDWRENDTVAQAALFNAGLAVSPGQLRAPLPSWEVQARHTQLTAVKAAEDGHGVVLRLVEYAGRAETVCLRLPDGYTSACLCNLLEDAGDPLPVEAGWISVPMAPHKIVSVRVMKR